MLSVYCRHLKKCDHRDDINWRRCHCPKWVQGTLPNDEYVRQTANTGSWEQAEKIARRMQEECDPDGGPRVEPPLIEDAVKLFRGDQKARGLEAETQRKYRTVLERQMVPFFTKEHVREFKQLRPPHLTSLRASWGNSPNTTRRKHEMVYSFLTFCVQQQYLRANPMKDMKKPKSKKSKPTDYFRPEEFEKIVAASFRYTYNGPGATERGTKMRVLTLLMRWSGLAILDAVTLERTRLSKSAEGDDQIFLYRSKTEVPVYVVIPPEVADRLRELPNSNPKYFFWSGHGDPRSARKGYERSYWKLFKLADIRGEDELPKRCHPHMFRDTFAVELLLAGNTMDQVSQLLGHSSVKITEEHYAPFCKARQLQLTNAVKRAWNGKSANEVLSSKPPDGTSGAPKSLTTRIQ